ncbi:flagellar basal-body MS-ring/collar protein FliF [Methylocapsa sp. S129]|uniref:flagellar basal-body MS-ring/collar protein FliF n=1 Tax=Methylocapsa sp. S129 TaxID=1641869 RepID=UPI00131D04D1|nr:flagellar basal-body MS-ring/collar protein FliF [Methylocapsa sp. S129]
MAAWEQAQRLWNNLLALGARRLAVLGMMGFSIVAATVFGGYYLSRPTMETLYSGLDRQDVAGIGSALKEAGIPFDVSTDGASVVVPVGQSAMARMTLAEKGLPHSSSVGNELFDKLGSLGLTSFMQEVTKVRAMEGELARTIQMMRGVKAARVHIVMADAGSFRRERQAPSASVVIRTESADDRSTAQAIRHLVSAALPGMTVDEVTVLNVDGLLLASGSDSGDQEPGNMLALEKSVSQDIQDSVRKTLAPYLSLRNFQISVAARLNTDKKQVNETTYDPESRVERSVRTVKENSNSQNTTPSTATGVERNLPQAKPTANDAKQSTDETKKNEELTNYEVSSKTVSTVSSGFVVEGLSVAVLVNRSGITASLGDKATPEAVDKQVKEIEQLVSSAAGLRKDRGDTIKVSVVDFVDSGRELEPVEGPSLTEQLMRQSGSLVSAGTVLLVAVLLIWLGLRPATRALLATPKPAAEAPIAFLPDGRPAMGEFASIVDNFPKSGAASLLPEPAEGDDMLRNILARKNKNPQKQLEQLVDYDEGQAAAILKQWIRQGENA